eukprot:gb/GEZN01010997.1/.p1 GENE.gb/GEZN01010997.1/~~gb/GEZN01010997.1/.p1  ORF type:complete len:337 (+),score=46.41 gb/GEZN01010997.1/:26-1036(+)
MSGVDYEALGHDGPISRLVSPVRAAAGLFGLAMMSAAGFAANHGFHSFSTGNSAAGGAAGAAHTGGAHGESVKPKGPPGPLQLVPPPRVILPVLPTVYVYDHCPFCVRVRLALGLKNIKHTVHFIANDDVATPTALVGKKMTPIFQWGKEIPAMGESLDIIALVDKDPRFGKPGFFKPMSDRPDWKAWQKATQNLNRKLQRPRYVKAMLPEFAQQDSRDAFVKNHQMPPYEKAEWKDAAFPGGMAKRWEIYEEAFKQTSKLLPELNEKLKELDKIIFSPYYCTESQGGLSMDDVDMWARLRSITIIKGAVFPPKARAYMDNLAKAGDIPLYDAMAL